MLHVEALHFPGRVEPLYFLLLALPFEDLGLHFVHSYDGVENPDEPHEAEAVKIVEHFDQVLRARPHLIGTIVDADYLGLSFGVTSEFGLCLLRLSLKHVVPYLERANILELGQVGKQSKSALIVDGLVDRLVHGLVICLRMVLALVLQDQSAEACRLALVFSSDDGIGVHQRWPYRDLTLGCIK